MEARALLEQLELGGGDASVPLAFLAAQALELDPEELRATRRRALLLLAAGGDPRRELEVEGRAVRAVAADLDAPERRAALAVALRGLRDDARGLDAVTRRLDQLLADPELAWRRLACALLAEELAESGG